MLSERIVRMKRTIVFIALAVFVACSAFATVRIGASAVAGPTWNTIAGRIEGDHVMTLFEEIGDDFEAFGQVRFMQSGIGIGIEGGASVKDGEARPLARLYAGFDAKVLKCLEVGVAFGCQMRFHENEYEDNLFWRLSGGLDIGPVTLELFEILPIPKDPKLEQVFNFGTASLDAQFGIGLGINI